MYLSLDPTWLLEEHQRHSASDVKLQRINTY